MLFKILNKMILDISLNCSVFDMKQFFFLKRFFFPNSFVVHEKRKENPFHLYLHICYHIHLRKS